MTSPSNKKRVRKVKAWIVLDGTYELDVRATAKDAAYSVAYDSVHGHPGAYMLPCTITYSTPVKRKSL